MRDYFYTIIHANRTFESMAYDPQTYWASIYQQEADARAVCYPDWPLSYNRMLHQQQLTSLQAILQQEHIVLKGRDILEIGPGSGFWTSFFQHEQVARYVGIELNQKACKKLEHQFPAYQFICQDASQVNPEELSQQGFDFIFCAMVLLHITDDQKLEELFRSLSKLLKPGGRLLILDAVYQHQVWGWHREQTQGAEFHSGMHNKIRSLKYFKLLGEQNQLTLNLLKPCFNLTQMCYDFPNKISYLVFGKLFYAFHRRVLFRASESFGRWYGAMLLPLDKFFTKTLCRAWSGKWLLWTK